MHISVAAPILNESDVPGWTSDIPGLAFEGWNTSSFITASFYTVHIMKHAKFNGPAKMSCYTV